MKRESFTNAKVKGISTIPSTIKLNKSWGKRFEHYSGISLPMPNGNVAAIFLDTRLTSGEYESVWRVFGKSSVPGHVVTCDKKEWTVEAEPLDDNHCGIIVYTAKRKPIMAGTVEVKKNGDWSFSVSTLYPGIRNSKRVTASLQGGARGGTGQRTEVQGGGTITVHF